MASGWMTVGGAGYRTKAIRKDAVKMVETTVQGDITKESGREMQIEALKGLTRAKGSMAREYHFAVIHVDETTPHLCDFVPLTKRRIYRRKS